MSKTCPMCGQEKPLDAFPVARQRKDGRWTYCKPCNYERVREWRRKNPDKKREQNRLYRERNPERVKESSRKTRKKHAAKRRDYNRTYREQNREAYREWERKYRKANPDKDRLRFHRRRTRLLNALHIPFSDVQLTERLSMFAGCWMCGGEATQIDHVKPVVHGGGHLLANLRPICEWCNKHKGGRWPLSQLNIGQEQATEIT